MDELIRNLDAIQATSHLSCYYDKTQALLRALKAGSVSLDNVTMTNDGWTAAEVIVEPPAEPVADVIVAATKSPDGNE